MFGMSFVYVVFEEGTDLYWARSRVLEYMSGIRARLPEGVDARRSAPTPPASAGCSSTRSSTRAGKHALDELRTFQDFTLRYALGSVPGVAEVASVGGYQKQYQVTVDPNRLRAYGVTLQEVIDAHPPLEQRRGRAQSSSCPAASTTCAGAATSQDLGAIERIALRARGPNGVPVLVKDVGHRPLRPEIRRGLARVERRRRGGGRHRASCATARTRSTSSGA